jgi:hypothetical protein
MKKPSFKLNGESVGYLLHGQAINIDFDLPEAWFVIVHHKKSHFLFNTIRTGFSAINFFKHKGQFKGISNAYHPKITFYGFGLNGIHKINIHLQVNFLNAIPHFVNTQNTTVQTIKSRISIPKTNLNLPHYMPNITGAEMTIKNIQNLQIKLDLSNLNYELSRQSN